MPLAAAGVGFTVTLGLLFTLWALMCYTALLLLEVYQHVPADMGLGSLAARYLGRYGQWVTGFCMLFLLYALTAAYISGAGELLASSLNQWLDWQLPPAAGVLIFTLLGGAVVCIGTALVDLFNRFLFSAKIVFLVIMLALLMPHIHQVLSLIHTDAADELDGVDLGGRRIIKKKKRSEQRWRRQTMGKRRHNAKRDVYDWKNSKSQRSGKTRT